MYSLTVPKPKFIPVCSKYPRKFCRPTGSPIGGWILRDDAWRMHIMKASPSTLQQRRFYGGNSGTPLPQVARLATACYCDDKTRSKGIESQRVGSTSSVLGDCGCGGSNSHSGLSCLTRPRHRVRFEASLTPPWLCASSTYEYAIFISDGYRPYIEEDAS